MIIFTQSNYITEVVTVVNSQLEPILEDRLKYSTESVSTTIYMADKIGIDQILRLSELYKNAKEIDPFPIRKGAYSLYPQSKLVGETTKKIYNAGVSCSNGLPEGQDPLTQLQHIWEQAILLGLGRNRDVYAERLLFLFDSVVCVYPAQNLDNFRYAAGEWSTEPFYTSVDTESYYIERDAGDFFGSVDSRERFSTYWATIRDGNSAKVGAIGLQLSQDKFYDLLPSTVLEEPYQLSFITIFEHNKDQSKDKKMIWSYYQTSDMDQAEWTSVVASIQTNMKQE